MVKWNDPHDLFPFHAVVRDIVVEDEHDPRLSPLIGEERVSQPPGAGEKRRREYRAGRHLAREALLQLGTEPAPVSSRDRGMPVFPEGVSGSLTHTGRRRSYVACVVTREVPAVGLDAEEWRALSPAMIERVLQTDEREALEEANRDGELDPAYLGLVAFSAKESVYKCAYPLYGEFLSFHDVLLHPTEMGFLARIARLEGLEVDVRWCEVEGRLLTGAFPK